MTSPRPTDGGGGSGRAQVQGLTSAAGALALDADAVHCQQTERRLAHAEEEKISISQQLAWMAEACART
eukprot:COSAG01_NODE_2377_length_7801_cov_4.201117_7_plen_69_part_00